MNTLVKSKEELEQDFLFYVMETYPNFKSDECSGGVSTLWKRMSNKPCPYNYYCSLHDARYFMAEREYNGFIEELKQKKKADIALVKDIWNDGRYIYDKPMAIATASVLGTIGNFVYFWGSYKKTKFK